MNLKVFGIARDIMGGSDVSLSESIHNVAELKSLLFNRYPKLKDLNSLLIAVNQKYASDEIPLTETDEIAIIYVM